MSKEIKRDSLLLIGDLSHLHLALQKELNDLRSHFCGKVVTEVSSRKKDSVIYIAGESDHSEEYLFIQEFAAQEHKRMIRLGQVPLDIHQVGVFFPQMFTLPAFEMLDQFQWPNG